MSSTATTLAVAASATTLKVTVTSATGATAGGVIKINDEYAFIDDSYVSGTVIPLRQRGFYGTEAKAHSILSLVTFSTIADLPIVAVSRPNRQRIVTIGANGAISVPTEDTVFVITKATALGSSAIADPDESQDGLRLTFTSATAAAHVLTFTNLHDGTTGAHTTVTNTTGFIGQGISVVAAGGKWLLVSNVATAIT